LTVANIPIDLKNLQLQHEVAEQQQNSRKHSQSRSHASMQYNPRDISDMIGVGKQRCAAIT
jgi:protein required for attachment to host cells